MVLILMNVDKVVKKETIYISVFVLIFSALMQSVLLILHSCGVTKWDYTALLGNLWGAAIAIGNFFVMCLYIQKAVSQDQDDAKKTVKASQSIRFAALVLLVGIGVVIPFFNWITVVVPLLFPSFAIFLRPLMDKNQKK